MPNKAIQTIFDWLLSLPSRFKGRARAVMLRVSAGAIALVKYVSRDAIVTYSAYGSSILIPLSHALPRIRLRHPVYGQNLLQIAIAVANKYPSAQIVDIGANVGDTAALIRQQCDSPMLCIDGDVTFFLLLVKNATQWANVHPVCAFIAYESGTISAQLDSHHGTGRFVHSDTTETTVCTLSDILASYPTFSTPTLIKVDTDGFDTLVLKGSLNVLRESHPIIYFEYDPKLFLSNDPDGHNVFTLLKSLGYMSCLFFANTGEFFAHAYLNDEDQLQRICDILGIQKHPSYFDICVFHECDTDICKSVHKSYVTT